MIFFTILLWSFCAVYFIRFFAERKMRVASIAATVLYVGVTLALYGVFTITLADAESETFALRSLADFVESWSFLPAEVSRAAVSIVILISALSILLILISSVRLCTEICSYLKKTRKPGGARKVNKLLPLEHANAHTSQKIYLLHCRFDC